MRFPALELWGNENRDHFQKQVAPLLKEHFQKQALKKLMMVDQVFWYVPSDSILASHYLLILARKFFPDLKLVVFGPDVGYGEVRDFLRAGAVDAGVLRFEFKIFSELENWFDSYKEETIPAHVLVRNKQGIIRFKKPDAPGSTHPYKVLLLLPPAWNNDYPPYGLAHITGALKEQGFNVRCLDYNARFWDKLIHKYGHCADFEHM